MRVLYGKSRFLAASKKIATALIIIVLVVVIIVSVVLVSMGTATKRP